MASVPAETSTNLPAQQGGTSMAETDSIGGEGDLMTAVSYTHLTLPKKA